MSGEREERRECIKSEGERERNNVGKKESNRKKFWFAGKGGVERRREIEF